MNSPALDADGNLTKDRRRIYPWTAEIRLIQMENTTAATAAEKPCLKVKVIYDWVGYRIASTVWKGGTAASPTSASKHRWVFDGWNVITEFFALSGHHPSQASLIHRPPSKCERERPDPIFSFSSHCKSTSMKRITIAFLSIALAITSCVASSMNVELPLELSQASDVKISDNDELGGISLELKSEGRWIMKPDEIRKIIPTAKWIIIDFGGKKMRNVMQVEGGKAVVFAEQFSLTYKIYVPLEILLQKGLVESR